MPAEAPLRARCARFQPSPPRLHAYLDEVPCRGRARQRLRRHRARQHQRRPAVHVGERRFEPGDHQRRRHLLLSRHQQERARQEVLLLRLPHAVLPRRGQLRRRPLDGHARRHFQGAERQALRLRRRRRQAGLQHLRPVADRRRLPDRHGRPHRHGLTELRRLRPVAGHQPVRPARGRLRGRLGPGQVQHRALLSAALPQDRRRRHLRAGLHRLLGPRRSELVARRREQRLPRLGHAGHRAAQVQRGRRLHRRWRTAAASPPTRSAGTSTRA